MSSHVQQATLKRAVVVGRANRRLLQTRKLANKTHELNNSKSVMNLVVRL
jgi:hypothetical protein